MRMLTFIPRGRVNPAYLRGMTVLLAMYGLPTSLKPRGPVPAIVFTPLVAG
jgi:hypothetical protein